jgi:hypothetical protein
MPLSGANYFGHYLLVEAKREFPTKIDGYRFNYSLLATELSFHLNRRDNELTETKKKQN